MRGLDGFKVAIERLFPLMRGRENGIGLQKRLRLLHESAGWGTAGSLSRGWGGVGIVFIKMLIHATHPHEQPQVTVGIGMASYSDAD